MINDITTAKTEHQHSLFTLYIILQSSVDHRSDRYECFYGIRKVVMSLIKFGKLNSDDCYDDSECNDSMIICPEELDNKNMRSLNNIFLRKILV